MSRADEIRKRIAKRKRTREKMTQTPNHKYLADDAEKYGFEGYTSYESEPGDGHPLFNKELFLFKVLTSACLVLIIAIIFRNDSEALQPIKGLVTRAMEEDFQFTAVSDWYESQFGKPLALLPMEPTTETEVDVPGAPEYALPAAARILEDFDENGQKITIETERGADVTAMSEGRVRYVGEEAGFGKTVIIQHADKSETWYGNLETIDVALYEFVKKGSAVGVASDAGDGTKGTFFFAIKKGDDFIDPIQVIQFD